ncbi:uncharacterized protein LOC117531074 [Thalassophryne amazonica]|uniref:uncharacterized protein LOC117531074 n=1 Tax=Thalassophryne amazonica TaxID=390379 RepID=UPI001470C322|nr:uncharacterized protein LOC117531074 [Thalassophryne amazonica]XP_034050000.1 uncharacterized protein LOC117531074 [Thalassophryne amazonica]XP_034050001.1 uncharacterized protein LOC117531074 [Thalassophryne amazonica]XP_034050002.1 uncharacterized protein LOC117531074 [Thalassophryne amazonica]
MRTSRDREMAIPRMFNSNTPFIIVTGGSELSFLGKEASPGCEDGKETLFQAIAPHLSWVMQQGTAKPVNTQDQNVCDENPSVSIVAQAEREDFQEFSPTVTQQPYSRSQLLKKHRCFAREPALLSDSEDDDSAEVDELSQHHLQWKPRRKTRTTRCNRDDGEERPVIRGLWVQEIDWFTSVDAAVTSSSKITPPPQFRDVTPHTCSRGGCSLRAEPYSNLSDGGVSASCCIRGFDDVAPLEGLYRAINTSDSSSTDDGGGSDSDCGLQEDSESVWTHESESDSCSCVGGECDPEYALKRGCCSRRVADSSGVEASMSEGTFELMDVSGFDYPTSQAEWDSDPNSRWRPVPDDVSSYVETSACTQQSLLGNLDSTSTPSTESGSLCNFEATLSSLRGRVTAMPKIFASPFFKDIMRQIVTERNISAPANEGLVFHDQLVPTACQYREGEDYCIDYHIHSGSYGDVFCVRDKKTGFKCAAKKIPLSHFSREELSTWSALDSPRVVELFGAVREGPNIVLFMDLKPACLAQLLKEMNTLPEDLALHYLHQALGALEHLHCRQVLHLDVKVDNVLLSADCRDTFLCDFGLSEMLDHSGQSTKTFRRPAFPGTETHMAPEVARGDKICAKADVWSSCCMLLHMLNGCPPWTRYYSHPLCLQIATEPPPLWEVPSNCNNFTAKVFRAGLQKVPDKRASAKQLRRETTKALRAVGGLNLSSVRSACEKLYHGTNRSEDDSCTSSSASPITSVKPSTAPSVPTMQWVSPWRTRAVNEDSSGWDGCESELDQSCQMDRDFLTKEFESQPKSLRDVTDEQFWETGCDSEIDIYVGEEEYNQRKWLKNDKDYEGDWEEDEEEDWDSSVSTEYFHALRGLFPLLQKGQVTTFNSWGSEKELEYLRDGDVVYNAVPSPEPRENPPSCFSCSEASQVDASEKDSDSSSDDLSSGVFSSCNSQADGHVEWVTLAKQPFCLEGVDIWIENVQGECLRIREQRQVKVGHVAVGISDQISRKVFTLETLDRKLVSFDQEIQDSCLWFRCVPAPDRCQRWRWRVRDGKLELRELD